MNRENLAAMLHEEKNYNCAQSVLCAFGDLTGLDETTALALTDGLGGGFKCGEICGALSGAILATGVILKNEGEIPVRSVKIAETVNALEEKFKEFEGSLTCRELVAENGKTLCGKYIEDAVKILEEIIRGE